MTQLATLRAQGRIERALRVATDAEAACAPLAAEARETKLDLLIELGDDEASQTLAREIAANADTPAPLAAKAREIAARPIRPRTSADLRTADELVAKNDLPGAKAAYEKAITEHPRDPIALAALADLERSLSHAPAARRLFDRALRAAGSPARVVTFSADRAIGPVTAGTLRPDGIKVGLLRRTTPSGGDFPHAIVGPSVTVGADQVLIHGPDRPLVRASRDGREPRALALRDVREVAIAPGDVAVAALAQGAVHRLDPASGEVLARREVRGKRLEFASPTRLVVETEVLRMPDLAPLHSLPGDAKLSPRVAAHPEARGPQLREHTVIVVRRIEDGSLVFERDLGAGIFDPSIEVHPSGRFVAWLGELYSDRETRGGILDVDTGRVTAFPFQGIHRMMIDAVRITRDGKAVCAHDVGWRASRRSRGKLDLCWVRDGEAVIASVPFTPKFSPSMGSGRYGGLSPDGKLAAFAETSEIAPEKHRIAIRVIEVATGKDVLRRELGAARGYDVDAAMVADGVVRVTGAGALDGHYDARTGAPTPAPRDAREPDIGLYPLGRTRGKWIGREVEPLHVVRGFLDVARGTRTTCWSPDLREVPADRCDAPRDSEVIVKDGVAKIPKREGGVKLSRAIRGGSGFVATLGGAEILVIGEAAMAHYFRASGELVGTVVALDRRRFVILFPDGSFEILGEGRAGQDLLACVAGERVFPFEACDELRAAPGTFLRRVEGAAIDHPAD